MGLFSRSRPNRYPGEPLPGLTADQSSTLTDLVCSELTRRGIRPEVVEVGTIRTERGQTLGLHNLALQVGTHPREAWREVVSAHLELILRPFQEEVGPPSPDQVHLKLRMAADLPSHPEYPAPEPLPGVLGLVVVDHPEHVTEHLSLEDLELGSWEEVRSLGLANLARLPSPERHDLLGDPERPDSVVHLLASDDVYGASRALVLDRVLPAPRPHGALVAVPNRHLLAVHPLKGVGVVAATQLLARIAAEEVSGPSPLSDELFYVAPDGRASRALVRDDRGAATMRVEGALGEAFSALGLLA